MGTISFSSGYAHDLKFIVEHEIKEKCLSTRKYQKGRFALGPPSPPERNPKSVRSDIDRCRSSEQIVGHMPFMTCVSRIILIFQHIFSFLFFIEISLF